MWMVIVVVIVGGEVEALEGHFEVSLLVRYGSMRCKECDDGDVRDFA